MDASGNYWTFYDVRGSFEKANRVTSHFEISHHHSNPIWAYSSFSMVYARSILEILNRHLRNCPTERRSKRFPARSRFHSKAPTHFSRSFPNSQSFAPMS
ncbi:hypothetical protein TNCV_730851 [Trichonephila clavipes]|nr:hypothetical protein TNCV_730851 [Trichonephila clavipes]